MGRMNGPGVAVDYQHHKSTTTEKVDTHSMCMLINMNQCSFSLCLTYI